MFTFLHAIPTPGLQVIAMALFACPAIWLNDRLKRRRTKALAEPS